MLAFCIILKQLCSLRPLPGLYKVLEQQAITANVDEQDPYCTWLTHHFPACPPGFDMLARMRPTRLIQAGMMELKNVEMG